MRTLLIAMAATLVAGLAEAQEMAGSKGHHHASEQKADTQKPKADEKAYKAALDRIPDGGKYDPWGKIRP
jgi:hypothetical protein